MTGRKAFDAFGSRYQILDVKNRYATLKLADIHPGNLQFRLVMQSKVILPATKFSGVIHGSLIRQPFHIFMSFH